MPKSVKKVSIFFFFFSLRLSSCPKVTTFPGLKPVEKGKKKNSFEDVKKSATLPRSKIRFRHLVVVLSGSNSSSGKCLVKEETFIDAK